MDWPADKVERKSVSALVPYARNARTHSEEQVAQIAASIREWGWTMPVLVDEDGGLIAGHGRVLAARKLGLTEIPVMVAAGWTEAQKRAYVLADNKLALNAGWDAELLRVELTDLQAFDFDLGLTGFADDELAALTAVKTDGLTDPDEAPNPPEIPVSCLGDVWLLGKHRLMCGDSTSVDDMEKLTAGQMVDMWLTDPPYNVAYEGGTKDKLTIQNDNMADDDFRQFLRDAYVAASTVMKPGAVFYIWHADSEGYNFRGAARDAGWTVRQCLIWKKSSQVMGRQDYHWRHEPCLYGWKDGAGHLWASDRKQTTILEFDKPSRNGEHPTMKPVALFEYQMLNNTKGGDIVLDSFGGSGTTLIAAEKNGRIARLTRGARGFAMTRYFLTSATIEGFRGINNDGDPLVLRFRPEAVNSVHAPNGVGKSSIYEALHFAIHGTVPRLETLQDAEQGQSYVVNKFHPQQTATVVLTFSSDDGTPDVAVTVTRQATGGRVVSSPSGHADPDSFLASLREDFVLVDYPRFASFVDCSALERGRSFASLVGLSRYSRLRQALDGVRNTRNINSDLGLSALDTEVSSAARALAGIEGRISRQASSISSMSAGETTSTPIWAALAIWLRLLASRDWPSIPSTLASPA